MRLSADFGCSGSGGTGARERRRRQKWEHVKLGERFRTIILADQRLRYIGPDASLERLAAQLGIAPHDVNIVRLGVAARSISAILAPHRMWYMPEGRTFLFKLKRAARQLGIFVILIPESAVRRQPRLDNSLLIHASGKVEFTASECMRVEMMVLANGSVPLCDCAQLIGNHVDPFGVVLAMVARRRLQLRLDRPINPTSQVSLAAREPQ